MRSRVKTVETLTLTERHGHTRVCRTQIKPNWARETCNTIQKFIQWLRKGQNCLSEIGIFSEVWRCRGRFEKSCFVLRVTRRGEKKFVSRFELLFIRWNLSWNLSIIMLKRKGHFMNSDLSIPRTFLVRWIEFSRNSIVFVCATHQI